MLQNWFKKKKFFFFCHFKATPVAHGGSQARGGIEAEAANLRHNNAESELRLPPTPQSRQCRILNPLSEARD